MRCQRCEFENMPGLVKCMRCGSLLAASAEPIDVHPPRMSSWKKPIRGFFRQLRKLKPASRRSAGNLHDRHFPEWIDGASRVVIFGVILSLIPGVAHVAQRRFHTIRWWVFAWLMLLLMGLFLFGSPLGLIILGLAIGIHVWIAVHSALLAEYNQFNSRMAGYLMILFVYFVLYHALGRVIFFNLRGGYSVINVPYAQVSQGDFLLGLVSRTDPEEITRGCFVLVRLNNIGNHGFGQRTNMAYAQVIGLGGDIVAIENNQYVVNAQLLDAEQYPLPTWLRQQKFSTVVPQGSYFISAQYRGTGYNDAQAISVCVVSEEQIAAKALLRWMPLSRRGFIDEY
jgi:hypothetical protein